MSDSSTVKFGSAPARALPTIPDPRGHSHTQRGCLLTARDLPKGGEIRRWTAQLRWIVAMAVKKGLITIDEAAARYPSVHQHEIQGWMRAIDEGALLPEMTKRAG